MCYSTKGQVCSPSEELLRKSARYLFSGFVNYIGKESMVEAERAN